MAYKWASQVEDLFIKIILLEKKNYTVGKLAFVKLKKLLADYLLGTFCVYVNIESLVIRTDFIH